MKKKLLFITSQLPELSGGSQVRNYYMLEHLKQTFEVTLCCVTDQQVNVKQYKEEVFENTYIFPIIEFNFLQSVSALLKSSIPYIERYRNSIPRKQLQALMQDADICFFSELNGYLIAQYDIDRTRTKYIIDAHNVEYIKFAGEVSSKSIFHRIAGFFVTPFIKRIEKIALQKMDVVFACSEDDKKLLRKLAPNNTIEVVPNGVDCKKFKPSQKTVNKNSVLFMGSLGYPPNDDALKYFIEGIYPEVKAKVPGVTFTIIGKGAKEWLRECNAKDSTITLQGFVPDVREYIAKAHVCICPLRFGSGTRLKILEYMAMAKPVVSTYVGAEGIAVINGEDIVLAKNTKEFSKGIIQLLNGTINTEKLGNNARKRIEGDYDWETIISPQIKKILTL